MTPNFSREFVVSGLLLLTLTLTLANQFTERSIELNTNSCSPLVRTGDSVQSEDSPTIVESSGDAFKFKYSIDAYSYPYATFAIRSKAENQMDLSWVEHFDIEIGSSKPQGEQLLLHVRNFEPRISSKDDATSKKYNEALLNVSSEVETIRVKRDEFLVPTWWKGRYSAKGAAALPAFGNVEQFEFSTHGDVGAGEIEIRSIRCSGNWINVATLNKTLLWLWLGGILLGVICRMVKLKRKLNEETASALELLQHNNLLISESATYHELARRDPLTGLLNRYGLEGKFEELSTAGGFAYALIMFDLDNFKHVNDTYGHCYGDRVLFDVARIVRSKTNKFDIVSRWGGDEFLVILNGRNRQEAIEFVEEIRHAVSSSDLDYTCSFGINSSESNVAFATTLRHADAALYKSKNDGRNTVNVYRKPVPDIWKPQPSDRLIPTAAMQATETPTNGFTIYE